MILGLTFSSSYLMCLVQLGLLVTTVTISSLIRDHRRLLRWIGDLSQYSLEVSCLLVDGDPEDYGPDPAK